MTFTTPVRELTRVGQALEKRLARLGISTAGDVLHSYPFRYEDFSTVSHIGGLQDGQDTTVYGTIELIANKRSPRKRTMITEALISDGTQQMRVVWFGQPFIAKTLKVGDKVYLSGKVKDDMFGMQMVSPSYEKVTESSTELQAIDTTHTARIVPLYPLTAGITQKQFRALVKQVLPLAHAYEEWIPESVRDQADVMMASEALAQIHFPENQTALQHAERRMKFDELFLLQLRAEMIRQSLQQESAISIPFAQAVVKQFVGALPFSLTKAQKIATWEILQDLEKTVPMNRLLEGDVGSGKTVVAAIAARNVIEAHMQVALMAPTEILAKQHLASFQAVLPDASILLVTAAELSGWNVVLKETTKKKRRAEALRYLRAGEVDMVIGTHALLTEDVVFKQLALVVVDEQHRFGVAQRKTMREKSGDPSTMPHFLSMTATPIPRSFALTLYGDLDLSIINELPAGRKAVKTSVIAPHTRPAAYDFIREEVGKGRQAFVICPLIEEKKSDSSAPLLSDRKSVLAEYEKLSQHIFPDLRISYLHGKMKATEKDETMQRFAAGEIDILVSTSVVEVGVNIPNASVMMIEGAEHFGLAQLHQFRGRVGRSSHQSYCFLFPESDSQRVRERLDFFASTTDGFAVAEYDLSVRGPGDVYGTMQSGMGELKFATMQDGELIKLARDIARGIDFAAYPTLREKVTEWEAHVHLE